MRLSATVVLALSLAACGEPATTPSTADGAAEPAADAVNIEVADDGIDDEDVLAEVGGVRVSKKEFQLAASRRTPADGEALTDDERKTVLDELIDQKILYLVAREMGLDRDAKVQKIMVQTLLRKEVYANVRNKDITDDELHSYFDTHRDEFIVPEKVQMRRIYLRVDERRSLDEAKSIAGDLRDQVLANASAFEELARKHSEDPYRKRGGEVGFVSRKGKPGVPESVVTKAFELKTGAVSKVFESEGGVNLLLVEARREAVERTFEQMRGSVMRKVKNDKYKSLYRGYVDDRRGNFTIERDDAKLAEIKIRTAKQLPEGARPRGPMPMPGVKSRKAPTAPTAPAAPE